MVQFQIQSIVCSNACRTFCSCPSTCLCPPVLMLTLTPLPYAPTNPITSSCLPPPGSLQSCGSCHPTFHFALILLLSCPAHILHPLHYSESASSFSSILPGCQKGDLESTKDPASLLSVVVSGTLVVPGSQKEQLLGRHWSAPAALSWSMLNVDGIIREFSYQNLTSLY